MRLLIGLALTLAALPAFAQTREDNLLKCASDNLETGISGCTALLQSGQETKGRQAILYDIRGSDYENEGQRVKAIADYRAALKLDPDNNDAHLGLQRLGASP